MKAECLGYQISIHYNGQRPSPMDPNDLRDNGVRITNIKTKAMDTVPIWQDQCKNKDDVLMTFMKVCQSAMFGANPAEIFLEMMDMSAEHPQAQTLYMLHRTCAMKMEPVIYGGVEELRQLIRHLMKKLNINENLVMP